MSNPLVFAFFLSKGCEVFTANKSKLVGQLANIFLQSTIHFIASCPSRFFRTFSEFREQSARQIFTRVSHFDELANLPLPILPSGACVYYNSKGLHSSINTRACKEERHWVIKQIQSYLIFKASRILQRFFHYEK
jgi:hypothetical protein